MKSYQEIFHADKPILAMLHLYGFTPDQVHELAKREMDQLYTNGVDAILVEDYFGSPDDVEWALDELKKHYPEKAYGVNLLSDPEKRFVSPSNMARRLCRSTPCAAICVPAPT